MSSPHGFRTALAARVLLVCVLAPLAGCGDGGGGRGAAESATDSAGRLVDARDEDGHRFRQVDGKDAPEVGIEVQPDAEDGWNLRLTVRHFRFSADSGSGKPERTARPGRGQAQLYLDGRRLARLHTPDYHLSASLVSRGTHELTARLYADDDTVWAVDGKPVETTADLTASDAGMDQESASTDARPGPERTP